VGPPIRGEIFKGLQWLKTNADKQDLSIVFLGGHGWKASPDEKFWFLGQDADLDVLENGAISGQELLARLRAIAGKKLLFLDACHAGAAIGYTGAMSSKLETRPNMSDVINDFTQSDTGIVAYAASQAQELAWEGAEFDNHGAFAKALIEAFAEGRGAVNGMLATNDLDAYLRDRVPELAKLKGETQTPVSNKPQPVKDFPIAVVRP
jgi:uncharacterized caspase-like protein